MTKHRDPHAVSLPEEEPVICAETVRMVLAVVVGLGWVSFDAPATSIVLTLAALVVSIIASYWTRRHVAPLARARR